MYLLQHSQRSFLSLRFKLPLIVFYRNLYRFGLLISCTRSKMLHTLVNNNLRYNFNIYITPFLELFQYFQYQKRKLLWDESWIIPYENVHEGMIISYRGRGGAFSGILNCIVPILAKYHFSPLQWNVTIFKTRKTSR